jgi:membrane associated rhomboid family serine protease
MVIYSNSQIPIIGASGAISGIMGSYFVLYPYATIKVLYLRKIISVPAVIFLGGWITLQILFGAVTLTINNFTNVAWFAHIGGFIAGAVSTYFYKQYFINDDE